MHPVRFRWIRQKMDLGYSLHKFSKGAILSRNFNKITFENGKEKWAKFEQFAMNVFFLSWAIEEGEYIREI